MTVRAATIDDIEPMLGLADAKRRAYAAHTAQFHRPARDAVERQRPWFARLIGNDDAGTFVAVDDTANVEGFLILTLVSAPPVYDPGGATAVVDDFAVSTDDRWATTGAALLKAANDWARDRGAVQVVVVCGPHDEYKRAVLGQSGLSVVSEWFTAPLD